MLDRTREDKSSLLNNVHKRLPSLKRVLAARFGVALTLMVVISLLIATMGNYMLSSQSIVRERDQAIEALALSISPMVARFDLADVSSLLNAVYRTMDLEGIEIIDFYGQPHRPVGVVTPEASPDKTVTIFDGFEEPVGELRIWWGSNQLLPLAFFNGIAIAVAEIILVLLLSWLFFARTLSRFATRPILELHDFVKNLGKGSYQERPSFRTRELDELTKAFEVSWEKLSAETRFKEHALDELHSVVNKQRTLTDAVENALTRASMAICYAAKTDDQEPEFVGDYLPKPLSEAAVLFHQEGRQLDDVLNALDLQHDKIVGLSMPGDTLSYWEVQLSDTETWTLTPISLDSNTKALILQDVSAQKQAQERQQELRKLESLGVLTSGVAHDFNNILGIITGALDVLRLESNESETLEHASMASERGKRLVRQLLDVSRRKVRQLVNVDQASVLRSLISAMPASLGPNYRLNINILTEDGVLAEEDLLETTLVNLIINARDAMSDGGEIQVTSRLATAQEVEAQGLKDSTYIVLEVADTGHGIDPVTLRNIFDPFYTSKPKGQGTGLGLSMAHAFSTRSGGIISCDSKQHQGTVFRIFLRQAEPVKDTPALTNHAMQEASVISSSPSILMVDDEVDFLAVAIRYLKEQGCEVSTASNLAEFTSLISEPHPQHFDVIVTDMYLPDGTGLDVAAKALESIQPPPRLILSSGNVDQVSFNEEQRGWFYCVLEKPFSLTELQKVITSQ